MPTLPASSRRRSLFASHRWLAAGVVLAVAVLPVDRFTDLAERLYAFERQLGLAIVPATAILLVAVLVHLQHRRLAAFATAAVVDDEARAAREHARDLEFLVDFAGRVAGALDLLSLRRILEHDLPRLARDHDGWVVLRLRDRLETVIHCHPGSAPLSPGEVEQIALQIQQATSDVQAAAPPRAPTVDLGGHVCAVVRGEGRAVGVVGVRAGDDAVPESQRHLLVAVASLLAVAARNAELVRESREVGLRDGLTGCVTRAHALEALGVELRRSLRSRAPLSVLLFDLDHFKAINDRYGHLCGDAVLAAVGRVVHEQLRASDLKCRYGGEEFLVLLPDTPIGAATTVAESLRAAFERLPVAIGDEVIRFTVSLGVASMQPGDVDPEALVAQADAAMYDAKRAGRNLVAVAPPREPGPPPPLTLVRRPPLLRLPDPPSPLD